MPGSGVEQTAIWIRSYALGQSARPLRVACDVRVSRLRPWAVPARAAGTGLPAGRGARRGVQLAKWSAMIMRKSNGLLRRDVEQPLHGTLHRVEALRRKLYKILTLVFWCNDSVVFYYIYFRYKIRRSQLRLVWNVEYIRAAARRIPPRCPGRQWAGLGYKRKNAT